MLDQSPILHAAMTVERVALLDDVGMHVRSDDVGHARLTVDNCCFAEPVDAWTGELEMLAPGVQQDDTAAALLVDEYAPDGKRTRIILLILSESAIERGDDIVAVWEFTVGRFPQLPPRALEDAAAARSWCLLILAGIAVRTEFLLEPFDRVIVKTIGPSDLAVLFARV